MTTRQAQGRQGEDLSSVLNESYHKSWRITIRRDAVLLIKLLGFDFRSLHARALYLLIECLREGFWRLVVCALTASSETGFRTTATSFFSR